MRAHLGRDQLGGNPHPVARLAQTAFEDVARAKRAPSFLHVDRAALIDKGRIAGDDEQPFDARQAGDDVFDDAVDEIFLFRLFDIGLAPALTPTMVLFWTEALSSIQQNQRRHL